MLSFFRSRGDLCRRAFLIAVGAAVGFAAYSLHWYGTLRYAEAWDGTEQTLQVRVMEAPAEFDYYTRLHVQRTENPKLDLMLYDYRGASTRTWSPAGCSRLRQNCGVRICVTASAATVTSQRIFT